MIARVPPRIRLRILQHSRTEGSGRLDCGLNRLDGEAGNGPAALPQTRSAARLSSRENRKVAPIEIAGVVNRARLLAVVVNVKIETEDAVEGNGLVDVGREEN